MHRPWWGYNPSLRLGAVHLTRPPRATRRSESARTGSAPTGRLRTSLPPAVHAGCGRKQGGGSRPWWHISGRTECQRTSSARRRRVPDVCLSRVSGGVWSSSRVRGSRPLPAGWRRHDTGLLPWYNQDIAEQKAEKRHMYGTIHRHSRVILGRRCWKRRTTAVCC